MAIKTEYYMTRSDGVVLNRTYSDLGVTIMRDGVEYDEAVDPADSGRTYIETNNPCQPDVSAEQALAELVEVLR